MKIPDQCATHKILKPNLWIYMDKVERNCEQRQCQTCLRWYFHGEFGRGWAKGLKHENRINNILKP